MPRANTATMRRPGPLGTIRRARAAAIGTYDTRGSGLSPHAHRLPHRYLAARRRRSRDPRARLRALSPRPGSSGGGRDDGRHGAERAAGAGALGPARPSVRRPLPARRRRGSAPGAACRRDLRDRHLCRSGRGECGRPAAAGREARLRPGLRAGVALRLLPRHARGVPVGGRVASARVEAAAGHVAPPRAANRRPEPLSGRRRGRLGPRPADRGARQPGAAAAGRRARAARARHLRLRRPPRVAEGASRRAGRARRGSRRPAARRRRRARARRRSRIASGSWRSATGSRSPALARATTFCARSPEPARPSCRASGRTCRMPRSRRFPSALRSSRPRSAACPR